jgi:hypothetical protein
MDPGIDGLWTAHFEDTNGSAAGGVATFMDGSIFGGDSGHVFHGSVDLQGCSVGAYFRVQNVVPNIPNALGGGKYIEFHLRGELEDHGYRICAQIESGLEPELIAKPVEFRKKVDFLNGQTLMVSRKSPIPVLHTGGSWAGTDGKFGGFWTIEVESPLGTGTGVLLLAKGAAVGGNSNYTFIGTTQTDGDNIRMRLLVNNFMSGNRNLFGYVGNCEMNITGSLQRSGAVLDRTALRAVEEHSQIQGSAAVVHLPELAGHCRLKRRVPFPHHSKG